MKMLYHFNGAVHI